jgi:hypothetical protein
MQIALNGKMVEVDMAGVEKWVTERLLDLEKLANEGRAILCTQYSKTLENTGVDLKKIVEEAGLFIPKMEILWDRENGVDRFEQARADLRGHHAD